MKKLSIIFVTLFLICASAVSLFAEGFFGLNVTYSQFSNQLYTLEKVTVTNVTTTNSNHIVLNNLGPSVDFTGYFKIGPVYFGLLGGVDIGFGTTVTNGVSTNLLMINPRVGGSLGFIFEIPYVPVNLMVGASGYYAFGYSRVYAQLDAGMDIIFSKGFGLRFVFKMPYDLGMLETSTTSRIIERNALQGFTGWSVGASLLFFNQ